MLFENFHFAQPLCFSLLPLPVLIWGIPWVRQVVPLKQFADKHLLPYLQLSHTAQPVGKRFNLKTIISWWAIWILGIIALAQPRWEFTEQPVFKPQINLMILLDISDSMRVHDESGGQSRFEKAVQEITDLLAQPNHSVNIGLVAFAGIPHFISPLTDDYKTLNYLLDDLKPELTPVQGSHLKLALETVKQQLANLDARYTHLLLISDGDLTTEDQQQSLKLLPQLPYPLYSLGVGTPQGDFIPLDDKTWRRDSQGNVVISKLNEAFLTQLAQANQGFYQHASYQQNDTNAIIQRLQQPITTSAEAKKTEKLWHEHFYLAVWLMLFLLLPYFRRQITQ